jgi:hypothetical protein
MAEVLARIETIASFPAKWFKRARQIVDDVFLSPEAAGPREIANIYSSIMGQTTAPTEAAISRVLQQFSEATGLLNR